MHIFVLKENLTKALSIVGKGVSTKPQLPILSYILLKAEKDQFTLSATNLELGIVMSIGAKVEKEGEAAIPGKFLTDFVSSLTAEKVELILDGTNLIVKTNKTRSSFTTTPSSDFPPFPDLPESKKTFPVGKLKETILRTVFAASIDEGRPVLTGVKTTVSGGKISFAATDGYRMSKEEVETGDKKEELQVILPATSLAEVVRIASDIKAEEVGFSIIEKKNQVVFILPHIFVFTRLIDGEFPNIEKIIPQVFKSKVTVDREQFTQAVKTASLFARGAANIVKIKIEKEGLRISANAPQVGENEDFVEAVVVGEEMEIAFNFRFLLDILSHLTDKEIIFETSGPLSPGVFKQLSPASTFLHLIMPVRVQEATTQ